MVKSCMGKLMESYITDESGSRTAVVIPIERYEELLEDLHDLAAVAERRDETALSLEDVQAKLKADGIL